MASSWDPLAEGPEELADFAVWFVQDLTEFQRAHSELTQAPFLTLTVADQRRLVAAYDLAKDAARRDIERKKKLGGNV